MGVGVGVGRSRGRPHARDPADCWRILVCLTSMGDGGRAAGAKLQGAIWRHCVYSLQRGEGLAMVIWLISARSSALDRNHMQCVCGGEWDGARRCG